jgi:hypothetical protein
VNSEELELSLRTEFENYLKGVLAGMRHDISEFQKNYESEFEKHKAQMDGAFRDLAERFGSEVKFDQAFTESVVEHLRLARDDGAQVSAQAFSDAQQLDYAPASSSNYDQLRDAINAISNQLTQSAILRSLVDHVAQFTSRGAFFIVKNESFVCWRRFDANGSSDDENVRDIHFPVSFDTVLTDAVNTLSTIDGSPRKDDFAYLEALGFARPERMFAVPLTARGRGVAVLYTDTGDGPEVNLQAIESLVRVAALTVELRARRRLLSSPRLPSRLRAIRRCRWKKRSRRPSPPLKKCHRVGHRSKILLRWKRVFPSQHTRPRPEVEYTEPVQEYDGGISVEPVAEEVEVAEATVEEPVAESSGYGYAEPTPVEEAPEVVAEEVVEEVPAPVNDFAFASSDSYDASAKSEPEPEPVEEYAYAGDANGNGHSYEAAPEPVVEVAAAQPSKSRLSDRHVDLPIEVP